MIARRIKVIVLSYRMPLSLDAAVMTSCTWCWYGKRMISMHYISHIWARHACFQLKRSSCDRAMVRVPLLMWVQNQMRNQSFYWEQITALPYFSDTKGSRAFICGIRRRALSQAISWKYKKVLSAGCQHKYYLDINDTCGAWTVISMIIYRIRLVVAEHRLLFIQ